MKSFSHRDRQSNIDKFKKQKFDLVIIGGGITGAGAARDAADRGLSVALIEASDFASGTSSRSSKLIHGGIRYLENMEFKLVFEALNERTKLFEIAPHLVHPLRFMLPLYKNSRVGMFKMGLGMWLYDALALFQVPEMHEGLSAKESLRRMPDMQSKDLVGSYVYSDAYMDDDRLVHETLRSANDLGATSANYVKAVGVEFNSSGKIIAVKCQDQVTHENFSISTEHVISSVGPWTDQLGAQIFKDWKNILRPTKGIHLTLPKNRLPLSSAVVMAAEKSDRIVFGIPRHEMIIIGTTDTDFKDSPETVSATNEDVDYLLKIVSDYFPGAKLKKEDIIASYSGVRPLVKDESGSEGKTSREHVIFSDPRGVTFVAGGKYTTYRLMAEQVVDAALEHFDFEKILRLKKANTSAPLNQHVQSELYRQSIYMSESLGLKFNRSASEAKLLAERYGGEAEAILQNYPRESTYHQLEAYQAIHHTMCLHLTDFYSRRVPLFLAELDHGVSKIKEVVQVFSQELGWTKEQSQNEVDQLESYIKTELAWKNTN